MEIFIKAAQLVTSLSILIILHELGHFIPAKLFKTRVEKFYLFFNPWFSLFKVKRGETEYGLGWLPLGGYVKISGMIDESMDKEQMAQPPKPWEFRSKPAWQRLIIMIGGVTVNLILGGLIYTGVLFYYGEKYLPNENLKDGVWVVSELMEDVGMQNGDKVISIGSKDIDRFSDIIPEMLYGGEMVVERNGMQESVKIPENFIEQLIDLDRKPTLLLPRVPFMIVDVPVESHNAGIDLIKGDMIVGVGGNNIKYTDEFISYAEAHKGEETVIKVNRDEGTFELPIQINDEGLIGVIRGVPSFADMEKMGIYTLAKKKYGLLESIPAGINKAKEQLSKYIRQFKLIFNPETGAYKGVGGFAAIGNLFPATWNWQSFWEITAFLSLILAFMNILPIPALDGGHVMFLLYEIISGRQPSEKFLEYAQIAGFVLLMGLLLFANGNDIFRMFK